MGLVGEEELTTGDTLRSVKGQRTERGRNEERELYDESPRLVSD